MPEKNQDTYFLESGVELYGRSTGSDSIDDNLVSAGTELVRSHNVLLNPIEDANGCNETWCVCVCMCVERERYKLLTRRNP